MNGKKSIEYKEKYKVYCPLCGKWLLDIDLAQRSIVIRCRLCGPKLVILLREDGPQILRDRRKKPRIN